MYVNQMDIILMSKIWISGADVFEDLRILEISHVRRLDVEAEFWFACRGAGTKKNDLKSLSAAAFFFLFL